MSFVTQRAAFHGPISRALMLGVLLALCACEKEKSQITNEPPPPLSEVVSSDAIPMCEINVAESCEAESSTATETIYHCSTCGTTGQCPDCPDHDCKSCGGPECRCRVKHGTGAD